MRQRVIIIVFISQLLSQCFISIEDETWSEFIITNRSGVVVRILPTTAYNDTIILQNNSSKVFDERFVRGITDGISFASFTDGNPISVIFNGRDTIVHYNDDQLHVGNYYKQSTVRNFYNTFSYEKVMPIDKKHSRLVQLKYIFEEQDYLDAQ